MRIGLTGAGRDVDAVVRQAQRAEADGFTSLWYSSSAANDPLVAMSHAGKATTTIELGTAVLQTYACHPHLQAFRSAAAAQGMGRTGALTIGVGPSHQPMIEGMLGIDYSTPGQHTEEYVQILTTLLNGEDVSFDGEQFRVQSAAPTLPDGEPIPVLVSALAPRLLRVAGQHASGTIPWMANARAIEEHIAPRIREAAAAAGRPAPRIVAGLPVAVHDDVDQARETAARQFAAYGTLPNYIRVLQRGGISSPAEAAFTGNEEAVAEQIEALLAAGATDIWAATYPVGDNPSASRARTRAALKDLATA